MSKPITMLCVEDGVAKPVTDVVGDMRTWATFSEAKRSFNEMRGLHPLIQRCDTAVLINIDTGDTELVW